MIKIEKEKIYESNGYKFKNFITLPIEDKLMILEWRNSEQIRKVMVNKEIIPESSHLKFIEDLKSRNDCYYWLVENRKGVNVGVLDILHVDEEQDVGEIGYYMDPTLFGMGLEFVIECEFFVYNIIRLGNNIATVDISNTAALLLNTYLGDTYEGVKTIGDATFFYNNHSNGNYIIQHYSEFNNKSYLRYMKEHKNISNEIMNSIN